MSAARLKSGVALAAAATAFIVGLRWGTFAAGGSDSSCYLNQARLLSRGTTHIEQPLAAIAPWPRAEATFTPAGFVPSRSRPGVIVPICPAGLPLVMAAAHVVHLSELVVVPLLGALGVWWTFVLGRRVDSPLTGAASAVLMACSPIFLYQVVQPMTDVPAMAWWVLVAVLAIGEGEGRGRPLGAGLAASVAVMTRPNLLPLAGVVAIYLIFASHRRLHASASFLAGLAPGLAALAALQRAMYGSFLTSGYGTLPDLFQASHIVANVERYSSWLVEIHTPLLVAAAVAPALVRRRAAAWLCLALALTTLAVYLPYRVFEDWWYLRFLLPALPFLIVLSVAALGGLATRAFPRRRAAAVALLAAGLGAVWVHTARKRHAFDLRDWERPFIDAGTFVADRLPSGAAILTVKHSGSVQYYSARTIVSWDTLEPAALDRVLAFLRANGFVPMLLFETTEEPAFRARFSAASAVGGLDWPPMARVGRTIRVYDPADRARYMAGARIETIDVWPERQKLRRRRAQSP
jgi:hypothetical protein